MRNTPHVVSTRLSLPQYKAVSAAAKLAGNSLSDHIKTALLSVTQNPDDSEAQGAWFDIAKILEIDPQAVDAMVSALEEIINTIKAANPPPESQDPSASAPDAPVANALSKHEILACAKHNMDPVEYVIRKRSAVRRAGDVPVQQSSTRVGTLSASTRAELVKRGMSVADFEAAKKAAVRRAGE